MMENWDPVEIGGNAHNKNCEEKKRQASPSKSKMIVSSYSTKNSNSIDIYDAFHC